MYFPTIDFRRGDLRYSCPISAIDPRTLFYHLAIVSDDYEYLQNIFRFEDSISGNRAKLYLADIEIESDADVIAALVGYLKSEEFTPGSMNEFLTTIKSMRRDYISFFYNEPNTAPVNPYLESIGNTFLIRGEDGELDRGTIVSIDTSSLLLGISDCPDLFTIIPTHAGSLSGEIILECLRSIKERVGLDITISEKDGVIKIRLEESMKFCTLLDFLVISVNDYMELPPSKSKSATK